MSITIANYLLARLAELGVRHMFGVPGDFNLWFLEQTINSSDITFIGCCNELNASYAADGCARLAKVSALVTTYGVGELAALAGVAGAYAERVPIVCITGAPPVHATQERALLHHTLADGDFNNMLVCYREFTVAQARIEPMTARDEIDRVLRACWRERRPVYMQLPADVAGVRTDAIRKPLDLSLQSSDPVQLGHAISRISKCLSQANRPAILLDADADRFGLTGSIIALAEKNSIPIAHLVTAKGVLSDFHRWSIGTYRGAASFPEVRAAIENSDCLLCVGTRFTDVSSGLFTHNLNPDAVVDVQPFQVRIRGELFSAVVAGELLSGLLAATRINTARSPISFRRPNPETEISENGLLTHAILWEEVQKCLQPGDVLVADTGTSFFSSVQLTLPKGVSFIGQAIWGALGYALPAALGTCLSAPDRRHLVFLGDGAFQMAVQELSTILRLDLKPIIFLINNDGYTIERLIYGAESRYNDISAWRYSQIPPAFDQNNLVKIHLVTTTAELIAALNATNDSSKLHFIEVVLPSMDAPEALVRFAQRVATFNFPQIQNEAESETIVHPAEVGI